MSQEMGRTEKSVRNMKFAMIAQLVTMILTFVSKPVIINLVGFDAHSINSLFTQVISAISLAEMGVGSAIVYNLYKPLAEGDHKKVSELMNLFRTAYWAIGAATMVIGLALTPWLQYLIKGIENYEFSYIRIAYLMFVFQSATSYLFSYKASLLQADQNAYLYTIVSTISRIIGTVIALIMLAITREYLVFLGVNIVQSIASNAYASRVVDKAYPYLNRKDKLSREDRKSVFANIKNLFIMLFAGKVVDSTDNLLISALVSTILTGVYANYITVTAVFKQLSDKLMAATSASMANLFVTEDTEKKITNLERMTFIFYVYASFASVGTYICVQPFVKMWIGNQYLLNMQQVAMICILCFVSIVFEPLKNAMFLTGDFIIGRNISFISAMTNLIVSIVLGRKIGLVGILIGTMCTYLIEVVAKTYFLFRDYFKTSAAGYAFMWVRMSLVFAAEIVAMHFINEAIALPTLADFLVKGVISVVVTAIVITLVFGRTDPFKFTVEFAKMSLNKVLRKVGLSRGA